MDEEKPLSKIPGSPNFRNSAVNAVAMVPLLSKGSSATYSGRSFRLLMLSLQRYARAQVSSGKKLAKNIEEDDADDDATEYTTSDLSEVDIGDPVSESSAAATEDVPPEVILVVPNSQLTRPGDWRYEKTPLQNFHWGHGCQRLLCFDGRPQAPSDDDQDATPAAATTTSHHRRAHDRLCNSKITRDWIDLVPSRRTAAVVGILNLRDILDKDNGLQKAEAELQEWAEQYSTPSYEVSVHGRTFARDGVVQRLFVFDSFSDGANQLDLTSSKLGSNLVAFPPADNQHTHMMDLHLNVVVNDLAVAIFRQLELRIKESDTMAKEKTGWRPPGLGSGSSGSGGGGGGGGGGRRSASGRGPALMGGGNGVQAKKAIQNIAQTAARAMTRRSPTSAPPQLLTPLDHVWDLSEMSSRDADAMKKRDVGRREKLAADLSLLAGSPMDAYERYSKAAELAKSAPDPLWYASALEGCAAAHMAMAEAGGYNVDPYLENNFQLPEEFMAVVDQNPGADPSVNQSGSSSKSNKSMQTLPAVIYALCEEALNIFNRHSSLATFHAELLLKLAWYTAFVEEAHLRCRWGEGEGCYGGDASELRRWEKTSVANLTFRALKNRDGEDLVALSSVQRCQRFCNYLHRSVSTGSLDPLTRADVSAAAARLCLIGLQSTKWKHWDGYPMKFPRKAALFTTVAAESISKFTAAESFQYRASALWLVVNQLYSKDANPIDSNQHMYGWAALRAATLHALSKQEDPMASEKAIDVLLALLNDISSRQVVGAVPSPAAVTRRKTVEEEPALGDDESVVSMTSRYSSYKYSKSASSRGFFSSGNSSSSQAALLTVAQAKWAEDDPLPGVQLPLVEELVENALANDIVYLNSVLPRVSLSSCALAQQRCIAHLSDLRQGMPTPTGGWDDERETLSSGPSAPLKIVSAKIVKSESHLLLERSKAHGYVKQQQGAMATFFNPFDNKKKQAEKKIAATLVAEGEEREVLFEFENRLSVPLEIPSAQIELNVPNKNRIKVPALSFEIPAKASRFPVHFPFIIIAMDKGKEEVSAPPATKAEDGETVSAPPAEIFEVTGLRVTCLSRSFSIPVSLLNEEEDRLVPESTAIYARSEHNKQKPNEQIKPRFEAVPAQPNLQVSFATSVTAIDDGTTVPVHLSDGEIFTLPSLRLQNDFGPSGLGIMERLQIVGVGLPGLPDEVLFDTDALAAAREEEDDELDSDLEDDEEDFEELMEEDGLPPLKMKALCERLSIKSINDKSHGEGSLVTFQVAATHDMGNQLANGGNVRIRFRYRGISPNPASEIWRKREVALRIVRVKGPRISSLTFRSDLSWGSAYSELCKSLAEQKQKRSMDSKRWETLQAGGTLHHAIDSPIGHVVSTPAMHDSDPSSVLYRVGMDNGVHVSSDEVVVLMAVANETNSTILLSNRRGRVGGFQGSPMPTVRVTSGVSVKIPVVIPRISRINPEEEDGIMDIAAELIANTALQWESVVEDKPQDDEEANLGKKRSSVLTVSNDAPNTKVRQGRVRIPSRCLREIIAEHPSFASRICKPPVLVQVSIGRKEGEKFLSVAKGQPVDTFVEVQVAGKSALIH